MAIEPDRLPLRISDALLERARRWETLKRWERRELGRDLRRVGLSYREIARVVPVSKGTLSDWCRDVELDESLQERLLNLSGTRGHHRGAATNRNRRLAEIERIRRQATAETVARSECRLWLAGVMLYWAEGAKGQYVCVTNSDAAMIAVCMRWLRECLQISDDRFTLRLHLHTGQSEWQAKRFWSGVCRVPVAQFGKTFWKTEGTGHRKRVLYNGTLQVVVRRSGDLLHTISAWIEACYHPDGPLAKLASQRTLNPQTPGSSPGRPTEVEGCPCGAP